VFRGKRGSLIKILWHDGLGMSLYAKRLERGRFIWPSDLGLTTCLHAGWNRLAKSPAHVALKFDAIFALERSINGSSPTERLAARHKEIAPLVDDLID
jgi:IS66 Orf2 like protein